MLVNKGLLLNLLWRAFQIAARNGFSFSIFYLSSFLLPKESFGLYNYIIAIAFFVSIFVDFGISMAVSKYTAEYDKTKKYAIGVLVGNALTFIFLLSISVSIIVFFVAPYFVSDHHSLRILIPLFFLVPATSLFDAAYRGLKRFKELSVITFITGLLSLAFFYYLINNYGLKGAFLSQNLFYFFMLCGLMLRFKNIKLGLSSAVIKATGTYTLIIGIIGLFMFFSTRVDILFLGHYGFYTELAYYEIIYRLLVLLLIPFTVIGHVLSPDFTKNYILGNYLWVKQKLKTVIIFSFIGSLGISILLYILMPFVFGIFFPKYNTPEMHHMSHVMFFLFFTSMFNGFIPLLAIATGHARWGMYFIVVVGILNLVFDYISINYWGVWGLIYSTVIIKSVANLGFIAYYYYKLPSK